MSTILSNRTAQDLISANYKRGKQTFIIPLTFSDLTTVDKTSLERISYGGDMWEFRADLLKPDETTGIPSRDYVAAQLAYLQQSSSLPVIFTIRTVSQGGKFPDNASEEARGLMLFGVEKGCEYIDVEFTWPDSLREDMHQGKKASKVIASFHERAGNRRWTDPILQDLVNDEHADVVKFSILATDLSDCHELALFVSKHKKEISKPIVAIAMGQEGQLSRVISPISFVGHPLIPTHSAPGLMSLAAIHRTQHLIGQLPQRDFFIFGNNISHSLSPTIHNAAFAELGLPYHYSIHQSPQIDDSIKQILRRPNFGGASVTYPHKLGIHPMLDSLSESAKQLGAINTVVVEETPSGRKLRGDNTDWLGVLKCLQDSKVTIGPNPVVIGAGGAAHAAVFALQQSGCQELTVVNRTRSRAEQLATDFPSLQINICDTLAEAPAANVVIACIPADDIRDEDIPDSIFAPGPGLVIEFSYRPPISALMRVAMKRPDWKVDDGLEVLKFQGYAQFEMWTGRRAPILAMEEALARRHAAG